MEYTPSFRDRLYADIIPSFSHAVTEDQKYGIPELNKFPMPDADHVRSAIKFFNYVTPAHEQQLASAILARMEEYGISSDSLNIGDENRFKKYLQHDSLMHHDIKGQKWGIRRYQDMGRDVLNHQIDTRKKISDIDPSAQSYRKTKKLVKNIIKDSIAYERNAYREYLNSPETVQYRRERYGY